MEIKLGDKVETPRFLTVRIQAFFLSVEVANENGFTEPSHFRDEDYVIWGKPMGNNRMIFAAIPRDGVPD